MDEPSGNLLAEQPLATVILFRQQKRAALRAIANMFIGPDARLRFIWRAVIFVALTLVVENYLLDPLFAIAARAFHLARGLSAPGVAFGEFENLLVALICTAPFAFYERRRIGSYGLPPRGAFGGRTGEGFAVGTIFAGAVALGMIALGGMQVHGLNLAGSAVLLSALAWLGANILVGVAEELYFRGYFLRVLWRSIGFWPASAAIALVFAADHYFFKPGENVWDVITLVAFSLLCCYSVLKTGTLWFAVGLHIAFDFMQLFVIGTPNGEQVPVGRLLNVTFNGPAWLTGGVLGTEASWLMYPGFVLAFLYVGWRYRGQELTEP